MATKAKEIEVDVGRFTTGLFGRMLDSWQRSRLNVALELHRAARDGIVAEIPPLEAALEAGNRTADTWIALSGELERRAVPAAAEQDEAAALFERIRGGGEPDLSACSERVMDLVRRDTALDIERRIVEATIEIAQHAVLGSASDEEILAVLNDAIGRVVAAARKAIPKFAEGATERDVLRGDRKAADAFLELDRLAGEYGRLREIFVAFIGGGGYGDAIAGRSGRILSECRNPVQVAVAHARSRGDDETRARAVLHDSRGVDPWPEEEFGAGPEERAPFIRRRLEVFARHGGEVWAPSPAELRAAHLRSPAPRPPAEDEDQDQEGGAA